MAKEKIVLVDGHSILSRAFYGIPLLTTQEGLHTNAVYGFLNIVLRVLDEEKPDYFVVAFDRKEPTFRHKMFQEYKGTRKPMPAELHEQIPLMKEVLDAMQVPHIELAGYEADDLLGTLASNCAKEGMEAVIVSGDRDLLQLASDTIMIKLPKTVKGKTEIFHYHASDVKAEYGVTPTEFIDMKALMGDTSDNIPGVPGIGEKGASAIIGTWHSIEEAYAHVDEIKPPKAQNALREHFDLAKMSKELATICTSAPITLDKDQARMGNFYTKEAYGYFKRLEFKTMLSRFDASVTSTANEWSRFIKVNDNMDPEALKASLDALLVSDAIGISLLFEDETFYGLAIDTGAEDVVYYPLPKSSDACTAFLETIATQFTAYLTADSNRSIYTMDAKLLYHAFSLRSVREQIYDLGIAAYLINPMKSSYFYEELALEYGNSSMRSREELLGKASFANTEMLDFDNLVLLGCQMASAAKLSASRLLSSLQEANMYDLYKTIEMPTCYCLADMEMAGIAVRKDLLEEFDALLTERIALEEASIYETVGETFNINSPKQLGVILFEKMGLPGAKKTKSGYSTSADILEKLQGDYPIVASILNYRMLTKLKSTYAEGLQNYISSDGRIHGTFHQTITATGRISSAEPNLQNIPTRTELGRELRKVFVAKEGCVLVDADFSQVELRILAHMSSDERLIEAYNSAKDIHAITASWVFNTPLEEVTPELRRKAKAVNFGIVYGISAFGLSEGLQISKKEAQQYIERYFSVYPGIHDYLDSLVAETKKTGYSYTLYQRRRPVNEIKSSNFMTRSFGERIAMNSPIQGTAADIMKLAVIRTEEALHQHHLKARIVLQVHDEIIVECPLDEQELVSSLLVEAMSHAASLRVPLEVEAHSGKNWFEAK